MSHPATNSTEVDPSDRRFAAPLRAWEVAFLFAFAAAILVAASLQSSKEYFGHDELFTAILASNPSYPEMLQAVRHGGELNPPLYFSIEWAVARIWGTGELALRSVSAISVALAAWVLFFTLRPLGGRRVAALAVALVIGLSWDVFIFMSMARYYGFLFLLVALGAFLVVRLGADQVVTRQDYVLIFLVHCALVYTHLYGCFYSGMLFAAMVAVDWLHGKLRWGVYFSWIAAWAMFLAWLPTTLQQIKSVTVGVWTPPRYYKLGFLMEELGLQIPLAVLVLLIVVLGVLSLIASSPCRAGSEAGGISAPLGWTALALVAVALMCVPIGTWAISQVKQPPLYMRRYIFPCTTAWGLMVGLVLLAVYRLRAAGSPFKGKLSPRFSDLAWGGVLTLCLFFQPMHARTNPARPAAAFTDEDYGYKNLPLVFEGSWGYVHRVVYGQGRRYLLLIDHDAAEASTGWYTKCMAKFFKAWYPRYQKAEVAYCDDLPDEFLAVDDDTAKTFEWVFPHHPEFQTKLLGTRKADPEALGQQRTYLVQRVPPKKTR